MWVCSCHAVTDHEIRDLLESPFVNTVDDVGRACGAGTGCGCCRDDIAALCAEAQGAPSELPSAGPAPVEIRLSSSGPLSGRAAG